MIITAGNAMVNSRLPGYARRFDKPFDKKVMVSVLNEVARRDPGKFSSIVGDLKKVGEDIAYKGNVSVSLDDFDVPIDKSILTREAEAVAKQQIAGKLDLNETAAKFSKIQKDLEKKTMEATLKRENNMAGMVSSGARGKPAQLASTITSSVMFADQNIKPIPVVIENSIAEGFSPAEYLANSFGARRGVVATKFATPEGGFFNKQVGYVAGEIIVVEDDCKTSNGIDAKADDSENIGRLLAKGEAGYPANTMITKNVLSDIIKKGKKRIYIRSPISCQAKDGICKKCFGLNENGKFPQIGDNPGINSSAAISEPFTQGAMEVKHSGGVIGKKKLGLNTVKQMLKIPKVFVGGATVSEIDGTVDGIEAAPQGGSFVHVKNNNERVKHYVQPGMELFVKDSDKIERGRPLSDGLVNPADVTRLRGIGEGRKYLSDSMKHIFNEDGKGYINKRHTEILSRAMVTGVKIDDHTEFDDHVPGDLVTIEKAQETYRPKAPYVVNYKKANGKFLAKPYLHHTIGSEVTPGIAKEIKDFGVEDIEVTDERPPFSPIMIRLDDVPSLKDNWINRMFSIHLKKKLIDSIHRGDSTTESGKGFVAPLIRGVDFGKNPKGY